MIRLDIFLSATLHLRRLSDFWRGNDACDWHFFGAKMVLISGFMATVTTIVYLVYCGKLSAFATDFNRRGYGMLAGCAATRNH